MARHQKPIPDGKVCAKCKEYKLIDSYSFKRPSGRKASYQPRCKECSLIDVREWRERQSPDRLKDLYLKRTYGLSLVEYNQKMTLQNKQCLLCFRDFDFCSDSGPSVPVVDHCHVNGNVRGIICNECNRGLGYFRDNPDALLRASKYIEESNALSEKRR